MNRWVRILTSGCQDEANHTRGPWRTAEQVQLATLEYVDWFIPRRLYEACGDIPPADLETTHLPSGCRSGPKAGQTPT